MCFWLLKVVIFMNNELNTWHFDTNNDKLVELVLTGKKTATTYLYNGNNVPSVLKEAILILIMKKRPV